MEDDAKHLTLQELVSSDCCLSQRRHRFFFNPKKYNSLETYRHSLAEAKAALPKVKSAYVSSGKTNPVAVIVLLSATPILLGIVLYLCWYVCLWYIGQEEVVHPKTHGASHTLALLSLLLDELLIAIVNVIPSVGFSGLSHLTKNRNAWLPSILTGISSFVISLPLFLPIWNGETLAPTNIMLKFIPIN